MALAGASAKEAVQAASAGTTGTSRAVDAFAAVYTPAIVLLAAFVAFGMPLLDAGSSVGGDGGQTWFQKGLVVLVAGCPCALVLASPIAVACALAKAAEHKVMVKSAEALERLPTVTHVALDKTGTVTEGAFAVVAQDRLVSGKAERKSPWSDGDVVKMAASVEACSSHPLAAAVVKLVAPCLAEAGPDSFFPVNDFKLIPGGVRAAVTLGDGRVATVVIGGEGTAKAGSLQAGHRAADYGADATVLFVSVDGAAEMALAMADKVRPTSASVVAALQREFKVQCSLLTGDRPSVAGVVGKAVGVDGCIGGMTPSGKKDWVVACQAPKVMTAGDGARGNRVLMVGDGINDGPALAAASVGVAMAGGGTALAITNADVALLDDDLTALLGLLRLALACRSTIWWNIGLALAIKVVVLVLAVGGVVQLWFAVVADVLGLLLVVANGTRLLFFDFAAASRPTHALAATASATAAATHHGVEMPSFMGTGSATYQPLLSTYPQGEGPAGYGTVR
jgi:Cd2+/Zn2+-exporting ATPase